MHGGGVGKITPINPVVELHGKDITQDGRKLDRIHLGQEEWKHQTVCRSTGTNKKVFFTVKLNFSFCKGETMG